MLDNEFMNWGSERIGIIVDILVLDGMSKIEKKRELRVECLI